MTDTPTPTPKTDEFSGSPECLSYNGWRDFSRTLERELSTAQQKKEAMRDTLLALKDYVNNKRNDPEGIAELLNIWKQEPSQITEKQFAPIEVFDSNGQPYLADLVPTEIAQYFQLQLFDVMERLDNQIKFAGETHDLYEQEVEKNNLLRFELAASQQRVRELEDAAVAVEEKESALTETQKAAYAAAERKAQADIVRSIIPNPWKNQQEGEK